jgi:Arc/MetJ-type ribon-helix-helix transcriptional regulator
MKRHARAKSSFTLPAEEHARVIRLRRALGARSNTEVIRRSLRALEDSVSRDALRARFREAAGRVRSATRAELAELDALSDDGLDAD